MEYDTIFAAARRAGNELALVDAGRLSRTVAVSYTHLTLPTTERV